ncbi:MAG: GIY-YIG nuclease family protein [Candidatus Hydrogenedentes bacterium]|nr:GIY-YIG nuclease family protein [Candidatus Hydrogenedentota bacterium]
MQRELHKIKRLYRRLVNAQPQRFPLEGPPKVSRKHGVYIIFSPRSTVLHVGRTVRGQKGLDQRLNNHLHGASSFTLQYLDGKGSQLRGTHWFAYVEVSRPRSRALLEAYAVGHLCPKHLGVGKNAS